MLAGASLSEALAALKEQCMEVLAAHLAAHAVAVDPIGTDELVNDVPVFVAADDPWEAELESNGDGEEAEAGQADDARGH
eukprot:SM000081S22691  [mRNA]  locus=s81:578737:579290:- [translate_table: standard]